MTATVSRLEARRLALANAGLLGRRWSDLPDRAGKGAAQDRAALAHIARPGYLQLDSVSVAGARSHAIVLASRLEGFDCERAERLLRPSGGLFEYWGHEACWMPRALYPVFGFRRAQFRVHPWWGDLLGEHPKAADAILQRVRDEGPLHAAALEGKSRGGWWNLDRGKKLVSALWSAGELAVCERVRFQRRYDLTERVIPDALRGRELPLADAMRALVRKALEGHGWATTTTIAATWRLAKLRDELTRALAELAEAGELTPCALAGDDGATTSGWIRVVDLERAAKLRRARPRPDQGVLLSPFDPVLWDRARAKRLFDFEQLLEIYKPAAKRVYGYYCLPILAGDALVGRVDLKANRQAKALTLQALHYEARRPDAATRAAAQLAVARYAKSVGCRPPKLS
ncbi:MAG: crosslink repair DNA glycosylase YcaQ family protein [Nannocystaceae bacterium]